ncbi:hypothetical protein QTG56_00560 [Rossellomorea sp. AcN35-11]|nr:hypothetical protein [Rossellomorea aquimaris]WJV29699.1 hypothetical protein QTG56_00560 [Rossellomorea sp. AcN35-11]
MDFFDFIIPLGILSYLVPIAFIAWFLISFIQTQKERNTILRDISSKLDIHKSDTKKE